MVPIVPDFKGKANLTPGYPSDHLGLVARFPYFYFEKPLTKMYIGAIIGYLSWPVMILLSYLAVRWALRYFEKRASEEADK